MLDPSPALGGMSFRLRRFQMPMEGAEGRSGSGCSRPLPAVTAFNLVQLPTSDLWRALYYLRCGLACMKVYMYSVDIYMYLTKHKKRHIYLTRQAGYSAILDCGQAGQQSANEANRGRGSSVRGLVLSLCVCGRARALYTTTAATLEPTVLCRAASANKHGTHLSTLVARPPPHTDQLLPPQLHGAQRPVPQVALDCPSFSRPTVPKSASELSPLGRPRVMLWLGSRDGMIPPNACEFVFACDGILLAHPRPRPHPR